jgi:hypothetical protein
MNPEIVQTGEQLSNINIQQFSTEYYVLIPLALLAAFPIGYSAKFMYDHVMDRVRSRRAKRMFDQINEHGSRVPTIDELDLSDLTVEGYARDSKLRESAQRTFERMRFTEQARKDPGEPGDGAARPSDNPDN